MKPCQQEAKASYQSPVSLHSILYPNIHYSWIICCLESPYPYINMINIYKKKANGTIV
jgi:hypothetical protein